MTITAVSEQDSYSIPYLLGIVQIVRVRILFPSSDICGSSIDIRCCHDSAHSDKVSVHGHCFVVWLE